MTPSADHGVSFRDLHVPGDPFILPCAWDVASAQLFAREEYRAIGTTSLGVAAGIGAADEDRHTLTAMAGLIAGMRRELPDRFLTCDMEDGYDDRPERVVEILQQHFGSRSEPAQLAVDGINIQDSVGGHLVEPVVLADKVAALSESFPDLFVNARIDTFWLGQDDLRDVIERIDAYASAGADGIFVPGGLDAATIREVTAASPLPVNVLVNPQLSRSDLAAAGVARISTGSLPYRTAISAGLRSVSILEEDQPAGTKGVAPYGDIAGLGTANPSSEAMPPPGGATGA